MTQHNNAVAADFQEFAMWMKRFLAAAEQQRWDDRLVSP